MQNTHVFKTPQIPKVSNQQNAQGNEHRQYNFIDPEKQNIIVEQLYVRNMSTRCFNDKSTGTQTDPTMFFTKGGLVQLLKCISRSSKVSSNGRPVFHCKSIAECINSLTGISITPDWIYSAFV